MPNTFISLDVPRGDGVGTPAVVSLTGHPRTFVLNGPVAGRFMVEGSCDGGKTWDILLDDDDGTQILFSASASGLRSADCVVEQVRVRGQGNDGGAPPAINMGAPPAQGRSFFGTLEVPAVPGLGAPLDLGLRVGPLKTFILRGSVPEDCRFTILASMDGLHFDEVMTFTSDQQGARSRKVMCRFVRVQRSGAAGQPPAIAVGAEGLLELGDAGGGGGGNGGGVEGRTLTIASDEKRETGAGENEAVLFEYAVPFSAMSARTLVARFSGMMGGGTAASMVPFRVRVGGRTGTVDGREILAVAVSGPEAVRSGISAPFDVEEAAALVKVTAEGPGAIVRGFVLVLEPADVHAT